MAKTKAVATRTVVVQRASRRRRHYAGGGFFKSLKVSVATIAGLLPGISFAFDAPEKDSRQILERFGWIYTGIVTWEPALRWDTGGFKYGLYPLAMGYAIHALANATGLNKLFRRIPMVEI